MAAGKEEMMPNDPIDAVLQEIAKAYGRIPKLTSIVGAEGVTVERTLEELAREVVRLRPEANGDKPRLCAGHGVPHIWLEAKPDFDFGKRCGDHPERRIRLRRSPFR